MSKRDDRNARVRARALTASRIENRYPELWRAEYAIAWDTIRIEQAELEVELDEPDDATI